MNFILFFSDAWAIILLSEPGRGDICDIGTAYIHIMYSNRFDGPECVKQLSHGALF